MSALPVGKAEIRREGRSGLALLAFGPLLESALRIAERLDATVVNMRFVKPLDENLVLKVAARHRALITLEENVVAGGAGSAIGELLASEGLAMPLLHIGIPDRFIEHGSREDCLAAAGLDYASVAATVDHWWALQTRERAAREA
jgi:1-deoxy-D-xylulose-5-phosphate synthase